MSKGLGRAERFILRQLDPLEPGVGIPLLALAHRYAHEQQLAYSRGVIETIRRAIYSVERKELADIDWDWVPITKGGQDREMLLVGAREGVRLEPAERLPANSETPLR